MKRLLSIGFILSRKKKHGKFNGPSKVMKNCENVRIEKNHDLDIN